MIKDITLGQYFPGNSLLHKLDPRVKILSVITFIIILFILSNIVNLLLIMIVIFSLYYIAHISFNLIIKNLKSVWLIIVFSSIMNIFFTKGKTLFYLGSLSVSKEGLILSLVLMMRIINMILISALLTYTASPIELTHALESLLKPLSVFKLPISDFALMMTVSLRFIPTLLMETDKIMLAQKSRGAKIDVGNIFQKLKSFIPIIVPLFVSAFKSADELAIAMECRCYNSGKGKTSIKTLKLSRLDFLSCLVLSLFFIVILLIEKFF